MSLLREAAIAFARTDRHPLLSVERLFATERVAAGLEARRRGGRGEATRPTADLHRQLNSIWMDRSAAHLADDLIERAIAAERRSVDRAIIETYLLHYPVDHRAFAALRDAAALAAGRHDWHWRLVGEQWRLWDGPNALGGAFRKADDPRVVLRDAGLVGRLADGAFVSAARAGAAR